MAVMRFCTVGLMAAKSKENGYDVRVEGDDVGYAGDLKGGGAPVGDSVF